MQPAARALYLLRSRVPNRWDLRRWGRGCRREGREGIVPRRQGRVINLENVEIIVARRKEGAYSLCFLALRDGEGRMLEA